MMPSFWQLAGFFGNTHNCVRILLPDIPVSVNGIRMHCAAVPDQRIVNALASLKLTRRETEVLFWISQGKSNYDIGVILGAKTGTVCKHVEHILAKLNVENRTAAAVIALEAFRSTPQAPKTSGFRPFAAISGFITTQLCTFWSDNPDLYREIARLVA